MKKREQVTDIAVILCRAEDGAIIEGLGVDGNDFAEIRVTAKDGTLFFLTPIRVSYKNRIEIQREIDVPDPEPQAEEAKEATS